MKHQLGITVDVIGDMPILEDRLRFLAMIRGGEIEASQLVRPMLTMLKREK